MTEPPRPNPSEPERRQGWPDWPRTRDYPAPWGVRLAIVGALIWYLIVLTALVAGVIIGWHFLQKVW